MQRLLIPAALLANTVALPACVFVPTVPTTASIDKVTLVVPLPEGTSATAASSAGTPWHRARLILSNEDGRNGDLVQNLTGVKGGLKAKAPLRGLPPGTGYHMAIELIQDMPDGNERIVARGLLGDDAPIKLNIGPNAVRMPVQPTFTGGLLSLQPIVIEPKSKSKSSTKITFGSGTDEDEDEDANDTSSSSTKSDDVGDVLVNLIAAAAVNALLGEGKDKKPAATSTKSKTTTTPGSTKTKTDTPDIWSALGPAASH